MASILNPPLSPKGIFNMPLQKERIGSAFYSMGIRKDLKSRITFFEVA
jgi:hypothetical protein